MTLPRIDERDYPGESYLRALYRLRVKEEPLDALSKAQNRDFFGNPRFPYFSRAIEFEGRRFAGRVARAVEGLAVREFDDAPLRVGDLKSCQIGYAFQLLRQEKGLSLHEAGRASAIDPLFIYLLENRYVRIGDVNPVLQQGLRELGLDERVILDAYGSLAPFAMN